MVAAGVKDERFVGYFCQRSKHVPDVDCTGDGRAVGEPEYEIAETEIVDDVLLEVFEEVGRLFAHELGTDFDRLFLVLHFHGLDEDRKIVIELPNSSREVEARLVVELPSSREADIGDDAEDPALVSLVELPGLLVILREQDLRPGPDAQQTVGEVDAFRHETTGLTGDFGIEVGKVDRVEPWLVFDQDYSLDTADQDVVFGVTAVLHLFDHRQQAPDVALPEKGPIELAAGAQILAATAIPRRGRRSATNRWFPGKAPSRRGAPQFTVIHVGKASGRDHHVKVVFLDQLHAVFVLSRQRESRRKLKVQIEVPIFLDHQLGELAVLFENEGVVMRGDEEDLDDAVLHQRREFLGVHSVPARQFD